MFKRKAVSQPLEWRRAVQKAAVILKEMSWEGLPVVGVILILTHKSCSLKPFTRNGCVLAARKVQQKLFWVPPWPLCIPVWLGRGRQLGFQDEERENSSQEGSWASRINIFFWPSTENQNVKNLMLLMCMDGEALNYKCQHFYCNIFAEMKRN